MTPDDETQSEEIEDLLHRRSDLSTFLVHYTRPQFEGPSAKANLISLLTSRTIEARSVYGILKGLAAGDAALAATQRCVCFTETPLEHAWMMCRPIRGRANNFGPYGIAFTKAWARREGVNPVWYLDQTIEPGHQWLTRAFDDLRDLATSGFSFSYRNTAQGRVVYQHVPIQETPLAKLAPFIEQMMPMTTWGTPKEFWWEREWRHVGNLDFTWQFVVAALAPESDHDEIETALRDHEASLVSEVVDLPKLLDPNWGLERMISKLAGVPGRDAGPFPK